MQALTSTTSSSSCTHSRSSSSSSSSSSLQQARSRQLRPCTPRPGTRTSSIVAACGARSSSCAIIPGSTTATSSTSTSVRASWPPWPLCVPRRPLDQALQRVVIAAAAAGDAAADGSSPAAASSGQQHGEEQQQHDHDDLTVDDNIIMLGSEDEDDEEADQAQWGGMARGSRSGLAASESAEAFAAAMAAARERVMSGSDSDDGWEDVPGADDDDAWDTPYAEDFWSTEKERVYLVGVTYKQQQHAPQQYSSTQQQRPRSLFGSSSSSPRGGLGMAALPPAGAPAASSAADAGADAQLGGGDSSSSSDDASGGGGRRKQQQQQRRRKQQQVARYTVDESIEELGRLAETAGLQVVGSTWQALEAPNNATYIGSGKVAEVAAAVTALKADTVIFDDELSPGQLRNLEKAFSGGPGGRQVAVADRTALILDIFSQRARTREGKLQVELAQTEYQLPRLSRLWSHLDRVAGGGQVKGMGEKQIEIDKRLLRDKAAALRRELEAVRTHRAAHRSRRQDAPIPVVALAGYTNAGKSTLLNTLTDAGVLAEDKLFATLDPTTRRVRLAGNLEVLVSDTVGFITKLPTQLVAAFRATLEEIAAASVIVHVLDVSAPNAAAQCSAVLQLLDEIGVEGLPVVTAWNKVDACPDPAAVAAMAASWPDVVPVSGATGEGLPQLLELIAAKLAESMTSMEVLLPYSEGALLDELHKAGSVLSTEYCEAGTLVTARVPRHLAGKLKQFQQQADGAPDSSSSSSEQLAAHQLPPDWSQLLSVSTATQGTSASSSSVSSSL